MSDGEAAAGGKGAGREKPARSGGYLFIPRAYQGQEIILWLRRMHAWTGVFGAALFFCLGLTGFYLNHSSNWRIDGGKLREVASLNVPVEVGTIENQKALADWMRSEFSISSKPARVSARKGELVLFDGNPVRRAASYEVIFRGPNAVIAGRYEAGTNVVNVTRQEASLLKALVHLHTITGLGKAYVLLADAVAGALMFMSLSGVLLWTRLHGSRLVAAGIVGAFIIAAALSVGSAWLGWTVP